MHKGYLLVLLLVCFVNGFLIYIFVNGGQQQQPQQLDKNFRKLKTALVDVMAVSNDTLDSMQLSLHAKQLKIIYYKTHKTASTTVGNILFRLGAQHGVQFMDHESHYYNFSAPPPHEADISLNHHKPVEFKRMMEHYRQMIPNGKFLTVLREPTRRYMSHFYYFVEPFGSSFEKFLKRPDHTNFLAKDLGIRNKTDLAEFMETAYDQFFFLITEKLDESLLLLKNEWGWNLEDILYVKLNDACKRGINYKRKPMSCRPLYENLTETQMQKIRHNNGLDLILYEKALKSLNARLAEQSQGFWNELAIFKRMRSELQNICSQNTTVNPLCEPYIIPDSTYEKLIRQGQGRVKNYTVSSVRFGSF